MLAALDNNRNVGRAHATDNSGDRRYKIVFPKGRKRWVAKLVKEDKNYDYIHEILETVIQVCAGTGQQCDISEIHVPHLPFNIASAPRPETAEVVESHKSRMLLSKRN